MASSRGKGKAASRAQTGATRRSTRSRASANDLPDVYQSMLQEADALPAECDDQTRPLKRRRVATPASAKSEASGSSKSQAKPLSQPPSSAKPSSNLQMVEDSSESDNSDIEFEDVDLGRSDRAVTEETEDGIEDLSISVEAESSTKRSGQPRRKPATYAEKAHRLMVHKLHVLCLLGHSMYVNGWCNNAVVHKHLRPLLNAKAVSYLKPKANFSQFQKNRSFLDGLEQAVAAFNARYQIISRGLQRPHWDIEDGADSTPKEYAATMDKVDFIESAKKLAGSQDVGNQLFCAMLRSVGVQTRLVCSLQPLPFGTVPKASTPKQPVKQNILAMAVDTAPSARHNDEGLAGSSISSIRRRLGQPTFAEQIPPLPVKKSKPVPKLAFPVYWVEAFNTAYQRWVSVDAIVSQAVNQPMKLEPPASYKLNQLTYAIAFEENGAARDVTKRYAKAFNAKTRRHRVESSHEGARWLKKAMRIFRRPNGLLDRDQVEDAELAQKEAREGMPANVLDFKDHPFYALERHLKRHEVLHPRREVGKVNAGTAAKPRMEAVYRRQDLLSCKSSDKWYRCGREIKAGEQPLKHIIKRARRQRSVEDDHQGDGDVVSTGLYAPHQTQLYVPPPVERGRIPKNAYGNLDIYVSSMVPAGGTHIRHKLTKDAAKLLRVDYADAVTGFSFKGRQGTAIVEGAVVAMEFADAVQAVIEGFEDQAVEDESRVRSLEALRLWKRFAVGLRIVERVGGYGKGGNEMELDVGERSEAAGEVPEPGGFFPDGEEHAMPTAGRFSVGELKVKANSKRRVHDEDSEGEATLVEIEEEFQCIPQEDTNMVGGFMPVRDGEEVGVSDGRSSGGGGFLVEDGGENLSLEGEGGGFLLDQDNAIEDAEEVTPAEDLPDGDHTVAPQETGLQTSLPQLTTRDHVEQIATDATADLHTAGGRISTPQQNFRAKNAEDHSTKSEESDKGSFLSHDPDDEDAEPDWLESD